MPTYNLTGFGPTDIVNIVGQPGQTDFRLQLDPAWDAQDDAYSIVIESPDVAVSPMSGPPTYTGDVFDETGSVVSSGDVTLGYQFTLTDPSGGTIELYSIQIDGTHAAFVADTEIQPGTTYSYTYQLASAPNPGKIYDTMSDQTYDHDIGNVITGGDNGDTYYSDAGGDTVDGAGGNDTILGGSGDDVITGGAGDDLLAGDGGSDTLTGGAGYDTFYVLGGSGQDVITDFDTGDDDGDGVFNDQINVDFLTDTEGNPVNVADVVVTDDGFGNARLSFPNGESLVLLGVPVSQMSSYQQLHAAGIPCFAAGTRIRTPGGDVPVETLRAGDQVTTLDAGPQPVLWRAVTRLGRETLARTPSLRPVIVKPGVLGNTRPVTVSQQHGLLLDVPGGEVFVRAKHLAETPLARIAHGKRQVTYVHLMFDRHQVISSDGIPSESFYPGPQALRMLGPAALLSLRRAAPWLFAGIPLCTYGPRARPVLPRKDVRHAVLPLLSALPIRSTPRKPYGVQPQRLCQLA